MWSTVHSSTYTIQRLKNTPEEPKLNLNSFTFLKRIRTTQEPKRVWSCADYQRRYLDLQTRYRQRHILTRNMELAEEYSKRDFKMNVITTTILVLVSCCLIRETASKNVAWKLKGYYTPSFYDINFLTIMHGKFFSSFHFKLLLHTNAMHTNGIRRAIFISFLFI